MAKAVALKAGPLIEPKDKMIISRRAVMKMTNDITKLPTYEILWRVYKRHSVGFWMATTILTNVLIIWNKIR